MKNIIDIALGESLLGRPVAVIGEKREGKVEKARGNLTSVKIKDKEDRRCFKVGELQVLPVTISDLV